MSDTTGAGGAGEIQAVIRLGVNSDGVEGSFKKMIDGVKRVGDEAPVSIPVDLNVRQAEAIADLVRLERALAAVEQQAKESESAIQQIDSKIESATAALGETVSKGLANALKRGGEEGAKQFIAETIQGGRAAQEILKKNKVDALPPEQLRILRAFQSTMATRRDRVVRASQRPVKTDIRDAKGRTIYRTLEEQAKLIEEEEARIVAEFKRKHKRSPTSSELSEYPVLRKLRRQAAEATVAPSIDPHSVALHDPQRAEQAKTLRKAAKDKQEEVRNLVEQVRSRRSADRFLDGLRREKAKQEGIAAEERRLATQAAEGEQAARLSGDTRRASILHGQKRQHQLRSAKAGRAVREQSTLLGTLEPNDTQREKLSAAAELDRIVRRKQKRAEALSRQLEDGRPEITPEERASMSAALQEARIELAQLHAQANQKPPRSPELTERSARLSQMKEALAGHVNEGGALAAQEQNTQQALAALRSQTFAEDPVIKAALTRQNGKLSRSAERSQSAQRRAERLAEGIALNESSLAKLKERALATPGNSKIQSEISRTEEQLRVDRERLAADKSRAERRSGITSARQQRVRDLTSQQQYGNVDPKLVAEHERLVARAAQSALAARRNEENRRTLPGTIAQLEKSAKFFEQKQAADPSDENARLIAENKKQQQAKRKELKKAEAAQERLNAKAAADAQASQAALHKVNQARQDPVVAQQIRAKTTELESIRERRAKNGEDQRTLKSLVEQESAELTRMEREADNAPQDEGLKRRIKAAKRRVKQAEKSVNADPLSDEERGRLESAHARLTQEVADLIPARDALRQQGTPEALAAELDKRPALIEQAKVAIRDRDTARAAYKNIVGYKGIGPELTQIRAENVALLDAATERRNYWEALLNGASPKEAMRRALGGKVNTAADDVLVAKHTRAMPKPSTIRQNIGKATAEQDRVRPTLEMIERLADQQSPTADQSVAFEQKLHVQEAIATGAVPESTTRGRLNRLLAGLKARAGATSTLEEQISQFRGDNSPLQADLAAARARVGDIGVPGATLDALLPRLRNLPADQLNANMVQATHAQMVATNVAALPPRPLGPAIPAHLMGPFPLASQTGGAPVDPATVRKQLEGMPPVNVPIGVSDQMLREAVAGIKNIQANIEANPEVLRASIAQIKNLHANIEAEPEHLRAQIRAITGLKALLQAEVTPESATEAQRHLQGLLGGKAGEARVIPFKIVVTPPNTDFLLDIQNDLKRTFGTLQQDSNKLFETMETRFREAATLMRTELETIINPKTKKFELGAKISKKELNEQIQKFNTAEDPLPKLVLKAGIDGNSLRDAINNIYRNKEGKRKQIASVAVGADPAFLRESIRTAFGKQKKIVVQDTKLVMRLDRESLINQALEVVKLLNGRNLQLNMGIVGTAMTAEEAKAARMEKIRSGAKMGVWESKAHQNPVEALQELAGRENVPGERAGVYRNIANALSGVMGVRGSGDAEELAVASRKADAIKVRLNSMLSGMGDESLKEAENLRTLLKRLGVDVFTPLNRSLASAINAAKSEGNRATRKTQQQQEALEREQERENRSAEARAQVATLRADPRAFLAGIPGGGKSTLLGAFDSFEGAMGNKDARKKQAIALETSLSQAIQSEANPQAREMLTLFFAELRTKLTSAIREADAEVLSKANREAAEAYRSSPEGIDEAVKRKLLTREINDITRTQVQAQQLEMWKQGPMQQFLAGMDDFLGNRPGVDLLGENQRNPFQHREAARNTALARRDKLAELQEQFMASNTLEDMIKNDRRMEKGMRDVDTAENIYRSRLLAQRQITRPEIVRTVDEANNVKWVYSGGQRVMGGDQARAENQRMLKQWFGESWKNFNAERRTQRESLLAAGDEAGASRHGRVSFDNYIAQLGGSPLDEAGKLRDIHLGILKTFGLENRELSVQLGLMNQLQAEAGQEIALHGKLSEFIKAESQMQNLVRFRNNAQSGGSRFRPYADMARGLAYNFGGMGMGFMAAMQVRQGFSANVQLEKSLAETQGVLGYKDPRDMGNLRVGVVQTAQKYGANLLETAEAAKILAQAGLNATETISELDKTMLGMRGMGMTIEQMQELQIAVKSVTGEVGNTGKVLEKISAIEARYAVTGQNLAEMLKIFSPVAKQMTEDAAGIGDAFDYSIGMATVMIEQMRISGKQAGNSLKFIFARFMSPEIIKSLQNNFGVQVAKPGGKEMLAMPDLLKSVSDRYQQIKNGDPSRGVAADPARAQRLLAQIGGARRVNEVMALFDNFGRAMQIAEESSLAFGSAERRSSLVMNTMSAQIENMRTSFQLFMGSLLEASGAGDALKIAMKGLSFVLAGISGEGSGGFGATALTLGGVGAFEGIKGAANWMKDAKLARTANNLGQFDYTVTRSMMRRARLTQDVAKMGLPAAEAVQTAAAVKSSGVMSKIGGAVTKAVPGLVTFFKVIGTFLSNLNPWVKTVMVLFGLLGGVSMLKKMFHAGRSQDRPLEPLTPEQLGVRDSPQFKEYKELADRLDIPMGDPEVLRMQTVKSLRSKGVQDLLASYGFTGPAEKAWTDLNDALQKSPVEQQKKWENLRAQGTEAFLKDLEQAIPALTKIEDKTERIKIATQLIGQANWASNAMIEESVQAINVRNQSFTEDAMKNLTTMSQSGGMGGWRSMLGKTGDLRLHVPLFPVVNDKALKQVHDVLQGTFADIFDSNDFADSLSNVGSDFMRGVAQEVHDQAKARGTTAGLTRSEVTNIFLRRLEETRSPGKPLINNVPEFDVKTGRYTPQKGSLYDFVVANTARLRLNRIAPTIEHGSATALAGDMDSSEKELASRLGRITAAISVSMANQARARGMSLSPEAQLTKAASDALTDGRTVQRAMLDIQGFGDALNRFKDILLDMILSFREAIHRIQPEQDFATATGQAFNPHEGRLAAFRDFSLGLGTLATRYEGERVKLEAQLETMQGDAPKQLLDSMRQQALLAPGEDVGDMDFSQATESQSKQVQKMINALRIGEEKFRDGMTDVLSALPKTTLGNQIADDIRGILGKDKLSIDDVEAVRGKVNQLAKVEQQYLDLQAMSNQKLDQRVTYAEKLSALKLQEIRQEMGITQVTRIREQAAASVLAAQLKALAERKDLSEGERERQKQSLEYNAELENHFQRQTQYLDLQNKLRDQSEETMQQSISGVASTLKNMDLWGQLVADGEAKQGALRNIVLGFLKPIGETFQGRVVDDLMQSLQKVMRAQGLLHLFELPESNLKEQVTLGGVEAAQQMRVAIEAGGQVAAASLRAAVPGAPAPAGMPKTIAGANGAVQLEGITIKAPTRGASTGLTIGTGVAPIMLEGITAVGSKDNVVPNIVGATPTAPGIRQLSASEYERINARRIKRIDGWTRDQRRVATATELGATLGNIGGTMAGGGGTGAQTGSMLGSTIGMMSAAKIGAMLGVAGGPAGMAIGAGVGLLGGLLGGLAGKAFDGNKTPDAQITALQAIEHAQRETITTIERQTDSLLNPENRLLNLPTNFSLPSYMPFGGAGGGNVYNNDVNVSIELKGDPERGVTLAQIRRVATEAVQDAMESGMRNRSR